MINITRFNQLIFIIAIVALCVGSRLRSHPAAVLPAIPQMEGFHGEIAIGVVLLMTGLSTVRIECIIEDDKTTVEGAV